MAPVLNYPAGATFLDDAARPLVNADAATYYGGGEAYTRSRTYSQVCCIRWQSSLLSYT